MTWKSIFSLWAFVYALVVPRKIIAAGLLPSCDPIPTNPNPCGVQHLFCLFVNLYNYAMGLAALIFFLIIVYAGFRMTFYWLSETPEQTLEGAKYTLTRGITGFVIVVGAYVIINTLVTWLGGDVTPYFSGSFLKIEAICN